MLDLDHTLNDAVQAQLLEVREYQKHIIEVLQCSFRPLGWREVRTSVMYLRAAAWKSSSCFNLVDGKSSFLLGVSRKR